MRRARAALAMASMASMASLALCAACRPAAPPPPPRPNVLLYVVDTLRADSLHGYGNPIVQTPHIDRFAREGTLFSAAWAQAPWTRASMASLFTSTYPTVHAVTDRLDALPQGLPTIAECFRAGGYRTGYIMTNPNAGSAFGFGRGFDDVIELYGHPGAREADDRDLVTASDEVTHRAIAWIARSPRPFFLVVFTIDPHQPYAPPAAFDRYGDACVERAPMPVAPQPMAYVDFDPERYSAAERERMRSIYYGDIAFNDLSFGRLLAYLRAAALLDTTVVAFTADHGEEFWEHGNLGHGKALFDESIHVPLILRYPRRVARGAVPWPVQTIDIFPTLLELAHLPRPPDIDGRSLSVKRSMDEAVWSGLSFEGRTAAAMMMGSTKVVWELQSRKSYAYDMRVDPRETTTAQGRMSMRGDALMERMGAVFRAGAERRARLHLCHEALAEEDLNPDVKQTLRQLGYLD